jgi:hypothetical protein
LTALIIGVFLFIFGAVMLYYSFRQFAKIKKINIEVDEENKSIALTNLQLTTQKENLENSVEKELIKLTNIQNDVKNILSSQTETSRQAFENYCDVLDSKYAEKEQEFNEMVKSLETAYANQQSKILEDIEAVKSNLENIKATRAALIEAQLKEKEIQEQLDFYCLRPSEVDKDDISKLERIKADLHNPRILSMLIWQTFFQKDMTTLCNNVLGTKTVTGIYKITNLNTNMCYIGQAVDVASRWKEHAKCGLGIDTPVGNKLYAAMIEEGIWNFSWELLESCERALLDEKEKYYIGVYQASEFGYNSNKGNSKKG